MDIYCAVVSLVKNRMAISDYRFRAVLGVGAAKASRVRQLQPKDEVISSPEMLVMDSQGFFTQRSQSRGCTIVEDQLIGVGATFREDSNSLSAPDQLRAAATEIQPSPPSQLRRPPIGFAVPSFHGLHREPVADPALPVKPWNLQGLGQGRESGRENCFIYREGASQAGEVFCQGARRPETCHSGVRNHAQSYRP